MTETEKTVEKPAPDPMRTTNILLGIIAFSLILLVAKIIGPGMPWDGIWWWTKVLGGIVIVFGIVVAAVNFADNSPSPALTYLQLFLTPLFAWIIFPLWYVRVRQRQGRKPDSGSWALLIFVGVMFTMMVVAFTVAGYQKFQGTRFGDWLKPKVEMFIPRRVD